MRRFFTWLALGALVGTAIATVAAPTVLETLLASTGAKDAMCQCTELVNNTARLLIRTQLWGAGIGAVLFPLGAFLFTRNRRKDLSDGATPTP